MSKHVPWTKEDAEILAKEKAGATGWVVGSKVHTEMFLATLETLQWAAAQIEKCETLKFTIRNGKVHTGSYEVFEAKLVGVREVFDVLE